MRRLVGPCRQTLLLCMQRAPDSVMADAQDSRKAWFFIETELLAIHRLRNLSHERVVRISQGSKARLPACCLPPASDANPCKCLPCPLAKVPTPVHDVAVSYRLPDALGSMSFIMDTIASSNNRPMTTIGG